jgi:hypothetical protein
VKGSLGPCGNRSIQRKYRKVKGTGSGIGKSLDQCCKHGQSAGHKYPVFSVMKDSFGILQFSISSAKIEESVMVRSGT